MNLKELQPPNYGREVNLTQINTMVTEFRELDQIIDKTVRESEPSQAKKDKARELKARSYNAFVFRKDLIMRFFNPPPGVAPSDYLMVILGAHDKEEIDGPTTFKAGSFTVITVGCNALERTQDGRTQTEFYPTNPTDPGNEYPPTQVVSIVNAAPLEGAPKLFFKPIG